MRLLILLVFTLLTGIVTQAQDLEIIEQDYGEATAVAARTGKLIFVDFYTSWCQPCKKLDKLVFENDSIRQELGKNFILLKYNAENDTVFHLSKKHHVFSYPTGLILTAHGAVLTRKYGFPGNDFNTLARSVLAFADEGIELHREGKVIKGYSDQIDVETYPGFYVDFVNRTNTKVDSSEINEYLSSTRDIFSEQYFSTLLYFASYASDELAELILENRDRYLADYGITDVEILFFSLTSGKFKRAIAAKNQLKYEAAVAFAKAALSKEWTDDILPSFAIENLKAQNKWKEVLAIYEKLKTEGKFDNGYINHVSWQVYKECDDQEVIEHCLNWMSAVTDEEPVFDYLDTYAFLMYKSGNISETKRIAQLAMKAAEKENRKTKSLEALIDKL